MDEWKGLEDVRITCDDMNSEEDYNKSSNNNNNYNSCLFGWLVGLALVSKRNESDMYKKKRFHSQIHLPSLILHLFCYKHFCCLCLSGLYGPRYPSTLSNNRGFHLNYR